MNSYTKLQNFGLPNGTILCGFSRVFRGGASAATWTERILALGVEGVSEVVRMAAHEQYPSLMPTPYPEGSATVSRPFGILDAMLLVFQTLGRLLRPS